MLNKLLTSIKTHKEEIMAIMALLFAIAILGFIFKDIIGMILVIFTILVLCNIDNLTDYIRQLIAEKAQRQALDNQQTQTIYGALAGIIFQGLSGQLGKLLGVIPPQEVQDIYPMSVEWVQKFNGIVIYRFTVHRVSGSSPISEGDMKRMLNSHLQRVCSSSLLPPKQGSTFRPYFYTVAVTPDTAFPDTFNIHVVYVDDLTSEAYVENCMREEADIWQQQLIDTQPPEDEEF